MKMCILDFITNGSSSKSVAGKHQQESKLKHIIYYNDNISMVEKGKMRESSMINNKLISHLMLDRKREWDAKTATCEFSSDDRERSSTEEDNEECLSSTCTLCTSSFSFCNASQHSYK